MKPIKFIPKRVFILEDDPYRIEAFAAMLRSHELTVAIDVEAAMKAWQPPYELMLLDHDLGGQQMLHFDSPGTGYQFCRWLESQKYPDTVPAIKPMAVVHSWNPDGARRMTELLRQIDFIRSVMRHNYDRVLLGFLQSWHCNPELPMVSLTGMHS